MAYRASHEMMAVFAPDEAGELRLVSANRAFAPASRRALGMTVAALVPWLGLPADSLAGVREAFTSAFASRAFTKLEPPPGGARSASSSELALFPVASDAGQPGILLVVHDLGERRAAAVALRESEDKFAKAFRASPGAMAISELRTGIFVEINDGYTEVFGYSRRELLGRSAEDLHLWLELEDQRRFVKQLRESGSVRDFEALGRTKNGQVITCIINAELGDIGGISCLVSSLRDVTQQRRIEAERATLETRLRQVHKLEALGTLAGGIAHDFNNILTTILSCVELALLDLDDPALVKDHLGEVRRASERARELVKQVLAFSRRQPPSRKGLRLEPIVEEVAAALRTAFAPAVKVEVHLGNSAEIPGVLGDSTQLHRVLTNIGTNAGQAMAGRPGTVSLRLDAVVVDAAWSERQPELRPGRYARITVEDGGHGMSDETLKHIFDPFFTTREHGGMGLGLAVVHGIVRDHDGAVSVQSTLGQGTRFDVYLPEHVGLASSQGVSPALERAGRGNRQPILLVDDEPLVCKGLQSVLERLNYAVTAFNDPREALRRYEASPDAFALVLTDLSMPKLTGMDLAKAILALRPAARVLLMTGFSVEWTPEKVRSLGLRDLLWKPISLEELASAVRRALVGTDIVAA